MSTGLHNGFTEGFPNNATTIDHATTGDVANYVGVFGNSCLFYLPAEGPEAGEIIPLAYGPTRCEMTGPALVRNTLILSVQHPSEDCIFDQTVEPAGALLNRGPHRAGVYSEPHRVPRQQLAEQYRGKPERPAPA